MSLFEVIILKYAESSINNEGGEKGGNTGRLAPPGVFSLSNVRVRRSLTGSIIGIWRCFYLSICHELAYYRVKLTNERAKL